MVKKLKFGIDMLTLLRIVQVVDAVYHGSKQKEIPIIPGSPESFGK